jgi:hypothetical protein
MLAGTVWIGTPLGDVPPRPMPVEADHEVEADPWLRYMRELEHEEQDRT